MQADGYAGFNGLYEGRRRAGALIEARLLGAHPAQVFRRSCQDRLGGRLRGPGTDRRDLRGRAIRQRQATRTSACGSARPDPNRARSGPEGLAETILPQLSGGSDLAKAFATCWCAGTALTRVFGDGRIALDNNPAERALRSVAIGRKNYLFAGSARGAERAAAFYHADRDGQAQRARSRSLPARRAHPPRRSSSQTPGRTPALELVAARPLVLRPA